MRILLFEEFVKAPQETIDGLTGFLGLPPMTVGETARFNPTSYPRSEIGQRLVNRVGRHVVATRYRNHMAQDDTRWRRAVDKFHYRWFKYINPIFLGASKAPPMRDSTRAYLVHHLSARKAGLSEVLGRDVPALWPGLAV